jgi:hypothetical protein
MFSENDILAMHVLRGRLIVVLSACETAKGGHGSSNERHDEVLDVAHNRLEWSRLDIKLVLPVEGRCPEPHSMKVATPK